MAAQKNSGKKTQTKKPPAQQEKKRQTAPAVFWLLFFVVITAVFLTQRETIIENFGILTRRLSNRQKPAPEITEADPASILPEIDPLPETDPSTPVSTAPVNQNPVQPTVPAKPEPPPAVRPPADQPAAQPPNVKPSPAQPAAPKPPASVADKTPPPAAPANTRERSIYFTQVGKDGTIFRSPVSRNLGASDSPMLDSLNSLLTGPTAEEKRRGIISLIPPNVRILSALVRGTTAYISFSEDFQYNTYGVEGYAAQLRQVVWTATEFPTVKDVQILIEGRRIEYLGEGIYIGVPVGRESL